MGPDPGLVVTNFLNAEKEKAWERPRSMSAGGL